MQKKIDNSAKFLAIYNEAMEAGRLAGNAAKPVPMIVGTAKSLFSNEIDHEKPTYFVADGVCGFASVDSIKGNSAFGKWLLTTGRGHKGYPSGVRVGSPICTQSYERNKAACGAVAGIFNKYGILCRVKAMID